MNKTIKRFDFARIRSGFSLQFPMDVPRQEGIWAMEGQIIDVTHPFLKGVLDATHQWHKLEEVNGLPGAADTITIKTGTSTLKLLALQPMTSRKMRDGLRVFEGNHPQTAEGVVSSGLASDQATLPGLAADPKSSTATISKPKTKSKG